MTRKEAKKAILTKFITEFNESTPVALTNQNDFKLCTSPLTNTTKPTDAPWIRFMIMNNSTPRQTIGPPGGRRFRRLGLVTSQVFVPEGVGTSSGDTLCEEIVNIFEGVRSGEISFERGYYEEIGNTDSGLFQYNVIIPYWFDETK